MDQSQIGINLGGSLALSGAARPLPAEADGEPRNAPAADVAADGDTVIEDLQSPVLVGLLDYWQSKRVDARPMPSRGDLDPIEMATEWLPLITLVDVETGTGRLRFRLVGTRVARDLGSDGTGQYLDELADGSEIGERLAKLFGSAANRGRPERLSGCLINRRGQQMAFEALALPLSSEGTAVDMILGGLEATPLK